MRVVVVLVSRKFFEQSGILQVFESVWMPIGALQAKEILGLVSEKFSERPAYLPLLVLVELVTARAGTK